MGRGKRKISIWKILILLIFLAVVGIILYTNGEEIFEEVSELREKYLFLAVLAYSGVVLAWGIKFYLLVKRRVKNARFHHVLLANMAGNFVNVTTPSGRMAGEPLRARYISKKYGARFSTVFAAAMMDKITLTIAMTLLLVPLTIYASIAFDMPGIIQLLLGAFVVLMIIIGIVSYVVFRNLGEKGSKRIGGWLHNMIRFILRGQLKERGYFVEKVKSGIMEFRKTFSKLTRYPLYLTLDLLLAVLIYGFRFVAAYMFFLATGYSLDFFTVSTVVIIAFTIGLLSQLPGMFGIGESTMTALYLSMGVRPATAITVSVLTQINVYVYEIVLGYVAFACMNFMSKRKRPLISRRAPL